MKEFVYNGKPQRLSKITAEYYPLFSYNAILKLIKDKEIRVDGAKVGEDVVVNGGSVIRCYAKDMRLKEIYRDENILIVYKPKGLKERAIFPRKVFSRNMKKARFFAIGSTRTPTDFLYSR